jgi:predicted MarR family transcription regulator
VKKHTKKEVREAASAAIHGLLSRLEITVAGKAKKLVKDISKMLAKEVIEENRKQLKKLRKKEIATKAKLAKKKVVAPPVN